MTAYAIPLLLAAVLVVVILLHAEVILLRAELRHMRASLDALAEMLGEAIDTWRAKP